MITSGIVFKTFSLSCSFTNHLSFETDCYLHMIDHHRNLMVNHVKMACLFTTALVHQMSIQSGVQVSLAYSVWGLNAKMNEYVLSAVF